MDLSLATVIGFVAGSLSVLSFLPQVVKCCRTKDTEAISLRMFSVRTFGSVLWAIYGYAAGTLPVLVFSVLAFVLCSIILVLKVRHSQGSAGGEESVAGT